MVSMGKGITLELAEKEVNFFAKYALAPPVLIQKLKLTNAADIARVFEISKEELFECAEKVLRPA